MLIPIYNNKNQKVGQTPFIDNLTFDSKPAYCNESGRLGLVRVKDGKYKNRLVLLYYNEYFSSCSRGEFISEEEAYDICLSRGRLQLTERLNIHPAGEVV